MHCPPRASRQLPAGCWQVKTCSFCSRAQSVCSTQLFFVGKPLEIFVSVFIMADQDQGGKDLSRPPTPDTRPVTPDPTPGSSEDAPVRPPTPDPTPGPSREPPPRLSLSRTRSSQEPPVPEKKKKIVEKCSVCATEHDFNEPCVVSFMCPVIDSHYMRVLRCSSDLFMSSDLLEAIPNLAPIFFGGPFVGASM